jgi:hypothetical protein
MAEAQQSPVILAIGIQCLDSDGQSHCGPMTIDDVCRTRGRHVFRLLLGFALFLQSLFLIRSESSQCWACAQTTNEDDARTPPTAAQGSSCILHPTPSPFKSQVSFLFAAESHDSLLSRVGWKPGQLSAVLHAQMLCNLR